MPTTLEKLKDDTIHVRSLTTRDERIKNGAQQLVSQKAITAEDVNTTATGDHLSRLISVLSRSRSAANFGYISPCQALHKTEGSE
jgi:hypothetical protein